MLGGILCFILGVLLGAVFMGLISSDTMKIECEKAYQRGISDERERISRDVYMHFGYDPNKDKEEKKI